ncbi:site-specific integrase [Neisseria animaloris]|uniref:site-specific integrase n=1 Tax=Neisseria animaloris TaxID=326522 RepID=UPI0039E155C6
MKLLLQKVPSNFNSRLEMPSHFFTREGVKVEIAGDIWVLPLLYRHSKLNFCRVENDILKDVIKSCIIDQASRVSTHAGCQYWSDLSAEIVSRQNKYSLFSSISTIEFEERLIALMEEAINQARNKHRLWALYRPIQWYIWCAENYAELGFSIVYAQELDSLEIPGNPKGEAVRQENLECGPLHRILELQPIINALKQDQSKVYGHLQQKAAVALSVAFGRNPANLTFLKETDFVNLIPDSSSPCYVLKMPRIKKRQLDPRDDRVNEYLDPAIAGHVLALINASKDKKLFLEVDGKVVEVPKPLFVRKKGNSCAISSGRWDEAFNMLSTDIAKLIKDFIKRHNIISPLTGELLYVTPRRLRYTLATGLAAEGISKRELARILDHTDTQHVNVYFEMAGKIVEHLDKATAKEFSKYLNFFKGTLIDSNKDAVNGERHDKHLIFVDEQNPTEQSDIGVCGESSVCYLDPPYSCYLCPKFQPYRHADHEHVLTCLLAGREERLKKYENTRLGIQLDEVISAVAQVAKLCE